MLQNRMKYNEDITYVLQNHIDKVSDEYWNNDNCKPVFKVSIINEDMNKQQILLTITHLCSSFTNVLFPRPDTYYGYETIESMMIDMYNQTM